jgi:hypothetical protein
MRAGIDTRTAANAAIVVQHHFALRRLAFGIVTPPAAEGAALEEDRGTDAGAVVDGIFFDVKDKTVCHRATPADSSCRQA